MKSKLIFIALLYQGSAHAIQHIPPNQNLILFLQQQNLHSSLPKLHLGCGQSHLPDYINIDFSPSEHTVQNKSGADIFGDITQLVFPARSLTEVRLHHVFEHFPRQKALALLAIWHHSLREGGIVVLETPDFEQSIRMILSNQYDYLQKQIILRHIFGSHEAFWAMHYDGWYEAKFRHVLSNLGFEVISVKKSSYLLTHNITVMGIKKLHLSTQDLCHRAHTLLKEHMVNNAPDEQQMWRVWCQEFDAAFLPFITE